MWLLWLLALSPVDLVPGAPQLRAAEARLKELISISQGAERATWQLQALWTTIPAPDLRPAGKQTGKQTGKQAKKSAEPPVDRCAVDQRLEPGWRAERFGAAWREAAQAVQAQAARVDGLRRAETVAPLVDAGWAARLDGLGAEAARQRRSFLESGAWQAAYVRPALAGCLAPVMAARPGVAVPLLPVIGEEPPMVAVIGLGEGYVCPGAIRAEGAVALLEQPEGCWAADSGCDCLLAPVSPGAVLAAPGEAWEVPEAAAPAAPAAPISDPEIQTVPQDLPEEAPPLPLEPETPAPQ